MAEPITYTSIEPNTIPSFIEVDDNIIILKCTQDVPTIEPEPNYSEV